MSSEYAPQEPLDEERPIRFGRLSFDLSSNVLLDGETLVQLAPKTCELLAVFLRNQGKLLSKSEIMEMVWPDTFVEESNLTHHIAALRKAVKGQAVIETMPRRGYRFSAELIPNESVIVQRTERRVIAVEEFVEDERTSRSRFRIAWAFAGIVMIGSMVVFGVYWAGFGAASARATTMSIALSVSGTVRSFSVSPDGRMIAFAWRAEGEKTSQIYVQLSGGGNPLKLSDSAGSSQFPAWSPDGSTVAYIRSEANKSSILLIPALGGRERKLCDLIDPIPLDLTWSPDGNYFAVSSLSEAGSRSRSIMLVNAGDGTITRLTQPPADAYGDFIPAFSPDSRSVAFRRDIATASAIYRVEIDRGNALLLGKEFVIIQSLSWPTNKNIIYAARRGSVAELFSIETAREDQPKKLANLSTQSSRISVARTGGGELYFLQNLSDTNIWETTLDPSLKNVVEKKKLIASPRVDEYAALSPDGQRIAFISDRSGFMEIWLANSDGTGQSKLTDLSGPIIGSVIWSPDGSQIAIHSSFGQDQDIYVVNAASGKADRITNGGKHFVRAWSPDGKWVYFATSTDRKWLFSKKALKSGETVVVDADGGNAGFEQADGSVVFCKMDEGGIWRKDVDGSVEQIVSEDEFPGLARSSFILPVDNGMIYLAADETGTPGYTFFDPRNGSRRRLLAGVPQETIGLSISKDARRWFANKTDYSSAEVIKVDGLVF